MKEITLIIADDHPIVRQGLRQAIERDAGLVVLAEAADGRSALDAVREHRPQIAILDVDMPELDGFAAARLIRKEFPETEIVFLTIHNDEVIFNEAIDLGAKGYVLKQSALESIIDCIKTVAKSEHYASPSLTTLLINRQRRSLELTQKNPSINDLTRTEKTILKMIADDKSTKDIADELFISPTTVEKHRANICRKLNLKGSYALLKFALTHRSELL